MNYHPTTKLTRSFRSVAAAVLAALLPSCAELGPTGNAALLGGVASGFIAASGDHRGAAAMAEGTLNAINEFNVQNPAGSGYGAPVYQTEGDAAWPGACGNPGLDDAGADDLSAGYEEETGYDVSFTE